MRPQDDHGNLGLLARALRGGTVFQFVKHHVFGYGSDDAPYKTWYLKFLAWRAPRRNWRNVWRPGTPRPWIGPKRDPRLASDAEFREIMRQNADREPANEDWKADLLAHLRSGDR